jgi:hypothetical protein
MNLSLKDRPLDTFADLVMTRTFKSSVDDTIYAVIDYGFGRIESDSQFAWPGKTEAEAVEGCVRWFRREASGNGKIGIDQSVLDHLKTIWERKENLVAWGVPLSKFDDEIRNGPEKLNWGLVSYDTVAPEFMPKVEGERLEGMLRYGMADIANHREMGAEPEDIDESLVKLRTHIATETRNFKCECTEDTYAILDARMANFRQSLTLSGPTI